jgi:hypothetical protein
MALRNWLTDTARTHVAANRSFLIWEKGYFGQCSLAALERQLGTPVQKLAVPSPTTSKSAFLLVYDHDLAPLLDPA